MTNSSKTLLSLLLLAAIAAGVYLFQDGTPTAPPVPTNPDPTPPSAPPPSNPEPEVATTPPVSTERVVATTNVGTSHADAPQGVRGRVVRPDGAPAAGVQVLLCENVASDFAQIFVSNKLGRSTPPIASMVTDDTGTFAVGVRKLGKPVDLRLLSEEFPELHRQAIKVREGDWYDTGDLKLEVGLVVTGRVVDQVTKAPIVNATIFLAHANQSHTTLASPGRERGIPTITDATGSFRYTNAPRMALINLAAEAPGYASTTLQNQGLKTDGPTDFTIELEAGQPIAGVVIDQEGKPVRGASVTATGLSAKTPQTATVQADGDGHFQFQTLRTGPYQLTASMTQFADMKPQVALTGESEVRLVLPQRASVKLRVLAANGQPVRAYRLGLKRHFANAPGNIGNVLDWPDRTITPADHPSEWKGEWALVGGIAAGDYRFQITEANHAKSLSEPFTVVEGGPSPEVVATLTLGATITGSVIDDRGRPVPNATVTTDMNGGLLADSPLVDFFRTMMPEKHSRVQGKTDAQGRFRLSKLAFADYMLRVAHPDYCEGTAVNIKLEQEGQVVDAGVIQLMLGAVVEGMTMIGGEPTGQVKVVLSTPVTTDNLPTGKPGAPGTGAPGSTRVLFNANVHSDSDGRFRLLKRVPPGSYKVTAQRPGANSDPFGVLMDMRETEQQITIAPGQEIVTLTFNLSRR